MAKADSRRKIRKCLKSNFRPIHESFVVQPKHFKSQLIRFFQDQRSKLMSLPGALSCHPCLSQSNRSIGLRCELSPQIFRTHETRNKVKEKLLIATRKSFPYRSHKELIFCSLHLFLLPIVRSPKGRKAFCYENIIANIL